MTNILPHPIRLILKLCRIFFWILAFKKIISMKTIGDKIQDKALNKIGEKSLFTKGSTSTN